MVKMKDVAERAGVSIATVSNVITGKRIVSPDVQKAVLQAISDLDYHVNMVARGLKTQRTYTIGVVLPDVTKLFFNDVLKGIMNAASDYGYSINILSSNYDFNSERKLIAALRGSHVDSIILDSCVDYHIAPQWGSELAELVTSSTPIVSIENALEDSKVSAVTIDCRRWSGQVTQHLIDQGCRRIYYISGPLSLMHEFDRLTGYRQALLKNHLEVCDDLITSRDFLSGSAYNVVRQALDAGVKFDAVQASNDQAAIGAFKALRERGVHVPGQVSVTGFDNLFPSSLVNPAITTVHVPRYTMGFEAVREAVRRIRDPGAPPKHLVLDCQLVLRGSSASVPETSWDLENW
jgi:DNA-binding LacI/PurR family transcriptional regulator